MTNSQTSNNKPTRNESRVGAVEPIITPSNNELNKIIIDCEAWHNWFEPTKSKNLKKTKQQLSNLIKELAGEEWHHNSEAWCAGANARREDMLQRATNLGFNIGKDK